MTIIPLLIMLELFFIPFLALKARHQGQINQAQMIASFLPVAGLTIWTAIAVILGISGIYESENFYKLYPALWMPVIPITIVFASLALPIVQKGIASILDVTSAHWLVFFQAGRISAIGTAYHTLQDKFPLYFEVAVGIPDLCFGLSALIMGILTMQQKISTRILITWHLIGCLIIVPTAPLLLQLGLPGALQVFTHQPTAEAVYTFPMSLAPIMVVPTFVLFNLLGIWRERRVLKRKQFDYQGDTI
ncbi:MAG: hypothetical protein F6K36_16420 [Symploca sp. SIO3C6]|uniref:Uncharacterized protein n=1 Tax=Symploca sp. SIO1C4 TaxID=2607765 RepID=A0A6B3NBW5_9CYAN|nr:hypothetical protein [Symploca sp. SIO3C6]NER28082.1 hypothetical protein [Symploca sp. SIO1C4]NET05739.1 hypothetical protein [Symploca sp. SIO2B6]